jgi:hypothetical protein
MSDATIELRDGPFGEENHSAKIKILGDGNGLGTPDVSIEVLDYEARKYAGNGREQIEVEEVEAALDAVEPFVDAEKIEAVRNIIEDY